LDLDDVRQHELSHDVAGDRNYAILVDPDAVSTGSVTLTLSSELNAGIIEVDGSSATTTINRVGQRARMTFSGTAGQFVSLGINSTTLSTSSDLLVYNPDGTTLTWTSTMFASTNFHMTLPATGTYSIILDPDSASTGSTTLTLSSEINAGSLTVNGGAALVTIGRVGQRARYNFSGGSGQQVTVNVTGNTMGSVTVQLVKPDGTQQTASTSSLSSFNLATQTLAATGTFSILVDPASLNTGSLNVAVTGPTVATKLAVTSVNGGNAPTAGVGFPVVVQAQDAGGSPKNVTANTGVSLSLKTGTGTLGGTLTGTIPPGSNQVTISGVTYTKAESGVAITASRTSGDTLTAGDSAPFTVNPGAAAALAFSTQPGNVGAGSNIPGPPTVIVQDSLGNTVTSSTASITVAIGTNPAGGTLSGTATKNATSGVASFTDLTLDKVGTGYTLTASATGLTGATSAAFNVSAGAAAKLVFSTQPGTATAGSNLPGPPTIAVQDNFGNPITSSSASITIAIANNPASGTLSGTTTVNASGGSASFGDLSIDQAGNGYTLAASSTGLTSATSNAFNVTGSSGLGIISGFVTRVSDATPVNGALVEVLQGAATVGTASTTASGSYSIGALVDGVYSVRATFTGFVPQIRTGVAIANGSTVTVNLSLNVGIAIHLPVVGTVINDFTVLVTGQLDTGLGEVGINVNGYVALQDGSEFATFVPLDNTVVTLTATVTNIAGTALASHTIPVTVQLPGAEPMLSFRPFPVIALVSQPVSFTLTSLNEIARIQLDGNGNGTIDFTGTSLEGVTVTFAEPGLYFPNVSVTDTSSAVFTDSALVQVVSKGRKGSNLLLGVVGFYRNPPSHVLPPHEIQFAGLFTKS